MKSPFIISQFVYLCLLYPSTVHVLYLPIPVISLFLFLAHRPGTEDVNVLKKELISVQTLMDKATLEQEKEKELVQQECDQLKQQIKK